MTDSDNRWMRQGARASSIGLLIMVSTLIGMGIGFWLDSKLGTKPWLAVVCTVVGLASGVYESVKILVEISRDNQ